MQPGRVAARQRRAHRLRLDGLDNVIVRAQPQRLDRRLFAAWWGTNNLPENLKLCTFGGFALAAHGETLYLWNPEASARVAAVLRPDELGEVVLVRPGEKIPVDGSVVDGLRIGLGTDTAPPDMILNMQLGQLTRLDQKKIQDEYTALLKEIEYLEGIQEAPASRAFSYLISHPSGSLTFVPHTSTRAGKFT